MGRKKKDENKSKTKVRISRGRSDKRIVDQFTRKFRNVIKSNGIDAAVDWLKRGPTREIGRTADTRRTIVLPMKKLWGILEETTPIIPTSDLKLVAK